MVATQFFFTLTFIETLLNFILVLVFFLCAGPDQKRYLQLIRIIGCLLLAGGTYMNELLQRHVIVVVFVYL